MRAPFEQRDPHRNVERLLHERNVFADELFLQCDRAGRKHDLLPAAHGRDQIGQRLSNAGAGFDDRVHAFKDPALDELRHLQLARRAASNPASTRANGPRLPKTSSSEAVTACAAADRADDVWYSVSSSRAGRRVDDDRRHAARREIDHKRENKAGQQSRNVRLPRNRGTVNVMMRLITRMPMLARTSSMPGLPSLSPIAKSAPNKPKIAPLAPTVGDHRRD